MSLSAVRKSGRIKTRKKRSNMSDDYEYDENKFDPDDESNIEIQTKSNVDISANISDLLHSHSKETNHGNVNLKQSQTDGEEILGVNLLQDFHESVPLEAQIFTCDICGKTMSNISSYDRHMKSHSSDRRFQCSQCEKFFPDSSNLKRHLKSHEDDRPFSCEICQKSFRDTASISRHMLTHTERPRTFQCSMCDKNFTDKTGLKRHERTHTGVRPFVCEVCQKSFMDSCSYKRHVKIHIGIKNFHCHKCKRSFMEKQSLVRHQKTVCKFLNDSSDLGQGPNHDWDDLSNHGVDYHQDDKQNNNNISNVQSLDGDNDDGSHFNHSSNSNRNSLSLPASLSMPHSLVNFNDAVLSTNHLVTSELIHNAKSPIKGQPSLGSLIKKDPRLYDSISEIVESIDSYEKMLDLCGDQGQKEIDAALTRDTVPMPNSLLCFECGELLVDNVNFKSEGKVFHPSMTNAFKCLACEADDGEDDDEFGEPPVLMPHYNMNKEGSLEEGNDNDTSHIDNVHQITEDCEATEKFYGTDEPIEQFQDRLKTQHGVYFVGNGNDYNYNQPGEQSLRNDNRTNAEESIHLPLTSNTTKHRGSGRAKSSRRQRSVQQSTIAAMTSSNRQIEDQSKLEYEANGLTVPSVFPCHLCTKVFASASFLSQHLSLHKDSPHKCMVCSKSLTSAPALKRHMRLHTGEKPYTCHMCQKQFRDPSNFGKHKKNCISFAGADLIPILADDCPPCPNLDNFCSNEDLNKSYSSVLSVESGEIQPVVNKNDSVVVSKRKSSRRQRRKKDVVDNAAFTNVTVGNLPFVYMDIDDSAIAKDGEELNVTVLEGESDNRPIMTVMPSLDGDDMTDQCDDENGEQSGIQDGKENRDSEKKANYVVCEVCQKLCENQDHLEMHMNYHIGNPNITCIECGKTFADSFGMKRHMRTHMGIRPYTCEYCNRGYCDNWTLKKHKSKGCVKTEVKVPIDLLHPCPRCVKVFCDEENLQVHMKAHKGMAPKDFECDVCHKRFSEAFNLKKHRRLHMAICSSCGQEFDNIQLLNAHQESGCNSSSTPAKDNCSSNAEEEKSFSCEVCARVYSTRSYLDRHRKIHSGIKPHVCEICSKRFAEAFKLRRHMKTSHSDEKPFICHDCGKCFSDDETLKRHAISSACALNKVMGEALNSENCACQFCDKVFQKSYMLVRHMTVHSQSRPFACEVCGRSYKDTSSLKRHQVTHLGVKKFICPTCGADFYYSDSLKRHMNGMCGRKTKTRRRKAVSWTRPRKRYPKKTTTINDVVNNNENDNAIEHSNSSSFYINGVSPSWKSKLHTSPYTSTIISDPSTSFSCPSAKKKLKTEGKWTCLFRDHCWLCDVKAPSPSAAMAHRRRVHDCNYKKRFSCPRCFIRLHKKIYWRAHVLSCCHTIKPLPTGIISNNNNNDNEIRKATRRRAVASISINDESYNYNGVDTESVGGADVEEFEISPQGVEDGKRPRRSVPRAKWSWISQI